MAAPVLDAQGRPPPPDLDVDFFGIGSAKAGSTWLARNLDEHPEVALSEPKEPNFFNEVGTPYKGTNPRALDSWQRYAACYGTQAPVQGEFTVHTMADPKAPERIQATFPDARFLVILRDPVRRLYSHYQFERRKREAGRFYDGPDNVEPTFVQALDNEDLVWRSRYASQLRMWFDRFPRDRFHVTVLEEAKQEPLAAVREVYGFLGVDPSYEPRSLHQKVNVPMSSRQIRARLSRAAAFLRRHHMGWLVRPVQATDPFRFLERIDWRTASYPPMDKDAQRRARQLLRPEVQELERMLGRRIPAWA